MVDVVPSAETVLISGDTHQIVRLMRTIDREGRYFLGDGPPLAESLGRHIAADDRRDAFYLVAEGDTPRGRERGQVRTDEGRFEDNVVMGRGME